MTDAQVTKRRAWYTVGIFTLLLALSGLDRYILSLVAHDVTRDLQLSDEQMGLLLGAAFAIVYSASAMPLGHVIDRRKRIPIVVCGVLFWSACTIAGAFADSFATLAASRAGLAIGEAVLTPAAISIIGDLFERKARAAPIGVYTAMSTIMATGSLMVGGIILAIVPALDWLSGMAPWRATMIIVGLPGIVVALVMLATVHEPPRRELAADEAQLPGWGDFWEELRRKSAIYLPFYIGVAGAAMFSLGFIAWAPTMLRRMFDMPASESGFLLGAVGIPGSMLAAAIWSTFAAHRVRRHGPHAILGALVLTTAMTIPFALVPTLAGSAMTVVIGIGLLKVAYGQGSLYPLAIQTYGPGRMHGRLIAVAVLAAHVVGLSTGSFMVPYFASFWPDDPNNLAYGVTVLGLMASFISLFGYGLAYYNARRSGPLHLAAHVAAQG